jgi:hypothetical protein
MADPVIGQLLPEPYQPPPYQPGGPGTPVLDPVQTPDSKTGMFTTGCGHWFNCYCIRQDSTGSGTALSKYGAGPYGKDFYGEMRTPGTAKKIACCPMCGYVAQILTVEAFDSNPFTFIA